MDLAMTVRAAGSCVLLLPGAHTAPTKQSHQKINPESALDLTECTGNTRVEEHAEQGLVSKLQL